MGESPPGSRGSKGGGSGPNWKGILGRLLWIIPIALFVLLVNSYRDEEEARISAERGAATAVAERDQAIQGTNNAIARANQETVLRATAEAELQAAQDDATDERRARIVAENRAERATAAKNSAESEAEGQAELRESAESRLESQRVQSERKLALQLARTNTTIKAIATGEIKFYIDPLPSYAADGIEEVVEDIAANLEPLSPEGATVSQTDDEDEADIYVRWVRDYGSHVLGRAVYQSVIHVGLGRTNCIGDWSAFDANTVKKILWHELGHAFGYGHSDNPNNIMFPTTQTKFASEYDVSRKNLATGQFETFSVCTSGKYHLSFRVDREEDTRLTFAVIPQIFPAEWYLDYDRGSDHNCGRQETRSIDITCEIGANYRVLVYNHNADSSFFGIPQGSITFSGQITLLDDPLWPDMQWDEDAFYYDDETLDYYRELFAEE